MHQRKIEGSSPGELSEENYLFTQDGLGGHINNSRRLLTKSLSVSECRKIVCGLVDLDHGGVCAPQRRSPPPIYTILAPTKTSSLFTQPEGLRTMPSISCKSLAPLPPAELLARKTVAPSLDADTHSIK